MPDHSRHGPLCVIQTALKTAVHKALTQNDTDAGKHYREISEWLDVMTSTTIISKGAVYSKGQKRFVTDRFHVFDRSVSVGKELEDGSIADANYVWLSSWQLDNINHKYLLPIDLESYRQLKNHIAKALVLHLQIWLLASHKAGSFEKRYEDVCEILDITVHRAPSLILRQLRPSLDELVAHGYLEKWRIEKTSDLKSHKVVLFHGEKFHRDRRKRIEQKMRERGEPVIVAESQRPDDPAPAEFGRLEPHVKEKATRVKSSATTREGDAGERTLKVGVEAASAAQVTAPEMPGDEELLKALMDRGITKETARELVLQVKPDQKVIDQLEWGEKHVRMNPGKFTNAAGFYIYLIRENVTVPADFETSRKRADRERAERQRAIEERRRQNYETYKAQELERYITEHAEQFKVVKDACTAKLKGQYGALAPSIVDGLANIDARRQIGEKITIFSFEEFVHVESALARAENPALGTDSTTQPPTSTEHVEPETRTDTEAAP